MVCGSVRAYICGVCVQVDVVSLHVCACVGKEEEIEECIKSFLAQA